ncbi:MAG: hypothetical protein COW55_02690 [Rhodobacteraceae bacterium CG17_big_fil_post_rev_8_21_14_2_50_65_11]|nr:MAG: hypothetical protein COW55_02690 [Rhodobacteraceae bacterium CG17_big_fil_post_rev_8_21_14_2_50_65_11]
MTDLKRILHVDDDRDIRDIAMLSLQHVGGFEVLQCASGQEAMEKAAGFDPQLFLFDVMMPEMSGDDLWAEFQTVPALSDVPVIFMTAKVERQYVEELMRKGALSVLEKPFDPITLSEDITRIWNEQT